MSLEELAVVRQLLTGLVTEEARSLEDFRTSYDEAGKAFGLPEGVMVTPVSAGGVPSEWLAPTAGAGKLVLLYLHGCLLYTSPSPRDRSLSRMPSSA